MRDCQPAPRGGPVRRADCLRGALKSLVHLTRPLLATFPRRLQDRKVSVVLGMLDRPRCVMGEPLIGARLRGPCPPTATGHGVSPPWSSQAPKPTEAACSRRLAGPATAAPPPGVRADRHIAPLCWKSGRVYQICTRHVPQELPQTMPASPPPLHRRPAGPRSPSCCARPTSPARSHACASAARSNGA